jgi:uncharacterized oligopeptide transporter (OPT) family protein
MTIATLLLTCLIFVLLGWMGEQYRVAALSIAAIVCIASSNGGTTSQDLKTGFLVGATPRAQQLAIVAGAVTSAVVIGFTLLFLNATSRVVTDDPKYLPKVNAPVADLTATETYEGKSYKVWWVTVTKPVAGAEPGRYLVDPTTGVPRFRDDPGIGGIVTTRRDGSKVDKYNPPQPALFAVIIDGILTRKLAWVLVTLGAALAVVIQLSGVSALAFAVGVYLPFSTTMPIFIGGLVRGLVDRVRKLSDEESDSSPAVLLSSGLIAGGSIAGILIAVFVAARELGERPRQFVDQMDLSRHLPAGWAENPLHALAAFSVLIVILIAVGLSGRQPPPTGGDGDLSKRGEIAAGDEV